MTTAVSATKPGDPGLAEIRAGLETRITETPVDTSVLNKLTEQSWFPGHLLN